MSTLISKYQMSTFLKEKSNFSDQNRNKIFFFVETFCQNFLRILCNSRFFLKKYNFLKSDNCFYTFQNIANRFGLKTQVGHFWWELGRSLIPDDFCLLVDVLILVNIMFLCHIIFNLLTYFRYR